MVSTYKAPALAKGLEILELLAPSLNPLTLSEICEELGRSKSELFRMVQELERTGYIEKRGDEDGYSISDKLFMLGMERPRVATLLEVALPEMRKFTQLTKQSCHIAIQSGDEIVVIARIESPGPITFSARIGHRRLFSKASSGVVIYTWSDAKQQKELLKQMKSIDKKFNKSEFLKLSDKTLKDGYMSKPSPFIQGVTDISAPIMRQGQPTASLTAPCISKADQKDELPIQQLLEATNKISRQLPPI